MAEKKGNPLIGAFRDPVLDIVPPEKKPSELSKTVEAVKTTPDNKAAEPAKTPAVDVKQKSEETVKSAADTKAVKAVEPVKTPAAAEKQKSEEPAKSVSDTKAVKAAEPTKTPAAAEK